MDIGGTIRQCRKARDMTLSQLADASGVSISHLSLLETNNREPKFSKLEAISKALGLPLSVLIFLAGQKEEVTELSASHIEALSSHIMELLQHVQK